MHCLRRMGTMLMPNFAIEETRKGISRRIYHVQATSRTTFYVGTGVLTAVSPAGRLAYCKWNAMGSIVLVDPLSKQKHLVRQPGCPIEKLVWSPDENWILFCYRTDPLFSFKSDTYGLGVIRIKDQRSFRIVPGKLAGADINGIRWSKCLPWIKELRAPCEPLHDAGWIPHHKGEQQ